MSPTRGGGTSIGPALVHGPHGPRSFGFRPPHLCSGPARRVSIRGRHVSSLTFPLRPNDKGHYTFPSSSPLLIQGGSGWYFPPIWESVAHRKGRIERLATLNQSLMQGLPSCFWVFGGRYHFSTSLPLLVFVKNLSLLNPSLYHACTGGCGGSHPGWRSKDILRRPPVGLMTPPS